jgi:hypothetical protein
MALKQEKSSLHVAEKNQTVFGGNKFKLWQTNICKLTIKLMYNKKKYMESSLHL